MSRWIIEKNAAGEIVERQTDNTPIPRQGRVEPTPAQLAELKRTTDQMINLMRKHGAILDAKDAGYVPARPVLTATTPESLRKQTRKHERELFGNLLGCGDPIKCRVCSGKGLTVLGKKRELYRKKEREQTGKTVTIERTPDAPTHTSAPTRDSEKPLTIDKEIVVVKEQPTTTTTSPSDKEIYQEAARIATDALEEPHLATQWADQMAYHHTMRRHIPATTYVDTALDLASRVASKQKIYGNQWSHFTGLWNKYRDRALDDAAATKKADPASDDAARLAAWLSSEASA